MKTWKQLEAMAKRQRLGIYWTNDEVGLYRTAGDRATMVTVSPGAALSEADRGAIVRAAIEAALLAMKGAKR